jgi:NADPH-dependent curcumin reductase CurA
MAELRNRQWLLAARPKGLIKESDFKWNETTTRALKDGELLSPSPSIRRSADGCRMTRI